MCLCAFKFIIHVLTTDHMNSTLDLKNMNVTLIENTFKPSTAVFLQMTTLWFFISPGPENLSLVVERCWDSDVKPRSRVSTDSEFILTPKIIIVVQYPSTPVVLWRQYCTKTLCLTRYANSSPRGRHRRAVCCDGRVSNTFTNASD